MRVREWRERRVLSQAELAKKADVTKATIVRIEMGQIVPQPRTIRKIAQALDIPPDQLAELER